ncbi:MAG: hypothetical protein BWK76_28565 [Desulfobulbaceae bacterium A2]|nr:MAG: hypothetical protein BWK76_28565 [Desulfobulbaceae bacterium A2]
MQAMILAAGFGTRLKPYSTLRPKPLFPVLNRPLLARIIDRLLAVGCDPVVVNAHHLPEQIAELLRHYPRVLLQREQEILGTGGGLRRALPLLRNEPLLVVNGDIVHDIDLAGLWQRHRATGAQVTLALHDYPQHNKVAVQGERVLNFTADSGVAGTQLLAFTGVQVVEPRVLERIPAAGFFHVIDLYETLAQEGEGVRGQRVDGCRWWDMGTPQEYLALHGALLTAPSRPWPERAADVAGYPLCLAPDARIPRDLAWHDWLVVGAGATIGAGAELSRCVVWDGAQVPAGARLCDVIVTTYIRQEAFIARRPAPGEGNGPPAPAE